VQVIKVDVVFTGTVEVQVPDHLNEADAKILAEKWALASLLATTENADCGECLMDACDEYSEECSESACHTAEEDFDRCTCYNLGGVWTTPTN
jgi:hypothetical protein